MAANVTNFAIVGIFIAGAVVFLAVALFLSKIIRPNKPNKEKLTAYESGEQPMGDAWGTFNNKYYIIAIVFLLFEVELMFLFPWAVVFDHPELQDQSNENWGWFSLAEMGVFLGVLVLALAYAWKNGLLDWVKKTENTVQFPSKIPKELYEQVNKKYS